MITIQISKNPFYPSLIYRFVKNDDENNPISFIDVETESEKELNEIELNELKKNIEIALDCNKWDD